MIVRAKVVVTMDGAPIENGAVAISRDRIVDVGKLSDVAKVHAGEEVVDLGEQAVLPGLINAHCHLDYTCVRGKIPLQKSFTDWIRAINAEKAKLSADDYVRSINEGFAEAKRFGTTTIANLTAFAELVSQTEAPIRTWWFAELIDVRDPSRAEEIVELAAEQLKSQEHWGLAPHAPFTASANLYRRCGKIGLLLQTHLAESREEMSMFRDADGPLYDFLKEIGRDMSDCGLGTPTATFLQRAVEGNHPYLFVHLNELAAGDFDLLKKSKRECSIVHCPRSHSFFGHSPFQFQELRELGFNVCLGTDSLASNDDLSLFAEMQAFQEEFPDVSPEKIVEMVTANPARALQQEKSLGKVAGGFAADLIAIPVTSSKSIFEQIVAFDRAVGWLMVGGRILG
ncbi:MAG TPA: amidohydrolase family protein [Chthoniobacterales bacterium]|nr:amidohydrolase family protein [Chthoniobacterales bacterium]